MSIERVPLCLIYLSSTSGVPLAVSGLVSQRRPLCAFGCVATAVHLAMHYRRSSNSDLSWAHIVPWCTMAQVVTLGCLAWERPRVRARAQSSHPRLATGLMDMATGLVVGIMVTRGVVYARTGKMDSLVMNRSRP